MSQPPVVRIAGAVLVIGSAVAAWSSPPASAQRPARPEIPNLAGRVLTVLGPSDPAALGQTLMHEHIFIDYKPLVDPTPAFTSGADAARYELPLTLETLYDARFGQSVRTRKFLGDFEESRAEVMEFKKYGGQTIVDVTNIGLGRDPRALLQMAHLTGLSIVMGAGWYAPGYHPRDMDRLTLEEMTDTVVRDIVSGVDGTGIRAGIIGEIGVDSPTLTPNELKSARASARASRLTGAPMQFHVGGVGEDKLRVLDLVAEEGADLSHVVMGHSGSLALDIPLARRVLARGVYLGFEFEYAAPPLGNPAASRGPLPALKGIVELIKAGYADRITLAHDVCAKQQIKKYGGGGFSYVSQYVLPTLKELGATDEEIRKIMVDNPARALTFVAPKPAVVPATGSR